jgi:hypothetical protein
MWDFSILSWFLKLLPDRFLLFIFYAFFFAGVALILASWFVSFIPLINRYRFPTQVIGILTFGFGAYLLGGYGIEMAWRQRVADMEEKVRVAEEKSAQVNTVIQEKIVYKTKVIEKKTVEYVDRIKEIAVEVDAKCEVDSRVIDQLNRASENPSKEAK